MNETTTLLAIKAQVVTCYSCGAWLGRRPVYYGSGDKGDYCHKCGNTSVKVRDGRPFGPRSKDWVWLKEEVDGLLETFSEDGWERREILDCLVFAIKDPRGEEQPR